MKQKIITAEIRRAVEKTPYGSTDGQRGEARVIARFFYPRGDNAFYLMEGGHAKGEKWDGHSVFGYCRLDGHEFELGRFDLDELINTKAEIAWTYGVAKVGIERDICVGVKQKTIRECMEQNHETAPEWWNDKPDAPAAKAETPAPVDPAPAVKMSAAVAAANNRAIQKAAAKLKKEKATAEAAKPDDGFVVVESAPEPQAETSAPQPEKKAARPRRQRSENRRAEKPAPKAEAVRPKEKAPGEKLLAKLRKLTNANEHTDARIEIVAWCANNATAEVDEFTDMLADLAAIKAGQAEADATNDGEAMSWWVDFRSELDKEMDERIGRVFGADVREAVTHAL